jgi:hypothetical protein
MATGTVDRGWRTANKFPGGDLLERRLVGVHKTQWSQDLYVSPGIRWAFNFRNGLQIVPGIAVPIGVGPSAGEKGMIFYLSFEHPFALAHSKIESGASREPGGEDPD